MCGGLVRYNRETALQQAIARVDESQSASFRAAGYAFFLQDQGFDFDEISEYLDRQTEVSSHAAD